MVETAGGCKTAGKKLKSKDGWNNRHDGSNGNGTDDYGFSALPSGHRNYHPDGRFNHVAKRSLWWMATECNACDDDHRYAYRRDALYLDDIVSEYYSLKSEGLSVRCVADRP